jgi:hypothetical protein
LILAKDSQLIQFESPIDITFPINDEGCEGCMEAYKPSISNALLIFTLLIYISLTISLNVSIFQSIIEFVF